MKIIFDSTVIVGNFHMRGPNFKLLEWFLTNREATLVVPQIVIAEVKNKYREDCIAHFNIGIKELNELGRLLERSLETPISSTDLEEYHIKYGRSLETTLTALNAEMPTHDEIPHQDIVKRDLSRRRPFRKTGKNQRDSTGYRDTLLWEIISRKVAPESELVIFITGNKRDFWDESASDLHQDLRQDLIRNGLPYDRVQLFDKIESFNNEYVKREIPKIEEAKILLEQGRYCNFSLESWLDENATEIGLKLEATGDSSLDFLLSDIDSFTIDWIEDINNLSIDEVLELDKSLVLIDLSFYAAVNFDLYVHGYGFYGLLEDSSINVSIDRYEKHGAWLSTNLKMPINITLMFNIDDRDVEGFEARFLETYGWCKFCGEPYMSDAAETCQKCGM